VEQGAPRDSNDGLDEGLPLGRGKGIAGQEHLGGAIFLAGSGGVAREGGVIGNAVVGDGADGVKQVGLVRFYLDQQVVPRVAGNLECFFDNAWRPG